MEVRSEGELEAEALYKAGTGWECGLQQVGKNEVGGQSLQILAARRHHFLMEILHPKHLLNNNSSQKPNLFFLKIKLGHK